MASRNVQLLTERQFRLPQLCREEFRGGKERVWHGLLSFVHRQEGFTPHDYKALAKGGWLSKGASTRQGGHRYYEPGPRLWQPVVRLPSGTLMTA